MRSRNPRTLKKNGARGRTDVLSGRAIHNGSLFPTLEIPTEIPVLSPGVKREAPGWVNRGLLSKEDKMGILSFDHREAQFSMAIISIT